MESRLDILNAGWRRHFYEHCCHASQGPANIVDCPANNALGNPGGIPNKAEDCTSGQKPQSHKDLLEDTEGLVPLCMAAKCWRE